MERVLGVLGGRDMPTDLLKKWAETADFVLAADSGADQLRATGAKLYTLVGDLDSVSVEGMQAAHEVFNLPGQDCTDCDKLLQIAEHKGATGITLACVEGDRIDHVLAVLASCAASPLRARLALRSGVGEVLKKGRHSFPAFVGQTLSLMPLIECSGVVFAGVNWPLNGCALSPVGRASISNVATQTSIEVELPEGVAVLFRHFPRDEMPIW